MIGKSFGLYKDEEKVELATRRKESTGASQKHLETHTKSLYHLYFGLNIQTFH